MCSIIGYRGAGRAAPLLVTSLKRMEYRGYDSVGVATINDGKILVLKGTGNVSHVSEKLEISKMSGQIGLGHTRWATHGGVTDTNAHPHAACDGSIAVVHNGIIENYEELKQRLTKSGHVFASETDSEVIAHLLEAYYVKGDAKDAVLKTCKELKGSFAFVAAFQDGTIAGARQEEPLIIGVAKDGYFISSDVLGFLEYTDKAIFLENHDMAIIQDSKLGLYTFEGKKVRRPEATVAWELGAADKGKYAHYTLKEINEQRFTIPNALKQDEEKIARFCDILLEAENVYITGSGTSFHSGLIGKHILSKHAKIKSEVIMSSEFQYALDSMDSKSVIIAISQSGETADVLHCIRLAKEQGAKILSIVNVPTSSLARMSDSFLLTNSGPEIGVAATKSFTGQLAVIYAVVGRISSNGYARNAASLTGAIDSVLARQSYVAEIAKEMENATDIYLLGRSMHYPAALEGALKMKELAYVHAEGIPAGELKHGPLALMEKNTFVIIMNPEDSTYSDTVSSAHEIKARGATVIGISNRNSELYDYWIEIPALEQDSFYPLIEVLPLQLMSYYLALAKNVDPDYPRNLAKSVTVR